MNITQFSRWLQKQSIDVRHEFIKLIINPARNIQPKKLASKFIESDKDLEFISGTFSKLQKSYQGRRIISNLVINLVNSKCDKPILEPKYKLSHLFASLKMATAITNPNHDIIKIAAFLQMRPYLERIYQGATLREFRDYFGTRNFDLVLKYINPSSSYKSEILPTHSTVGSPVLFDKTKSLNEVFEAERDNCWNAWLAGLSHSPESGSNNFSLNIRDIIFLNIPEELEPSFCPPGLKSRIKVVKLAFRIFRTEQQSQVV